MSQDYNNPAFKKLLQKLQEESWQLELLISGFAIFGLFQAIDPLSIAGNEAENNKYIFLATILTVTYVSCFILLFNLLLHVVLRGLWIGALGLRYVSGDIDYEELNYSPKFTKYLKNKIGSFDKYIGNLENYCSVIFAISFLLIFYVLAFTLTLASVGLIAFYLIDNDSHPILYKAIGIPLVLFILIGMILSFIDFITQGWLKKKKWISKIYFPIYWVFSFLTLSFLYRPLVYNFLDHKFGRRLSFMLVPLYFLILLGSSFSYVKSNYLFTRFYSNEYVANERNYENLLDKREGKFISNAAIPSKVITDNYLKVFIVFSEDTEDEIFIFNEGLKPDEDKRGLTSGISFNDNPFNNKDKDSLELEYMKVLNNIYHIKIDSTTHKTDLVISKSKTGELGFETFIDLKAITRGKHIVELTQDYIRKNDTIKRIKASIPFWYYPN